ncbi:MAG: hypothetical protein A2469_01010 [Candidatus Magasanikbacteria bacterium RIFOXYC2_FULL_40_16]|uniref:RDD domain-containing protein n=1 Tax=Candidatus Magasanikbacteria bacterium RIFOXYC2_FULL_40_16 TaxID=1798703 RepID=A0A1F6NZE7_9BACT|nr:MAG: hypothetical protein A2469_01010 [Candidatus Magasanikbacteria bacterium RIFOXYC2_FULL_40_16]
MRKEHEQAMNELIGRHFLSKILDIFAILLLLVVIVIIIKLFTRSLFEGFVSAIVGFWLIKYVSKKRNDDLFSKFQGWF